MLAHNCTIMEIPVNVEALMSGVNDDYEIALHALVDRVEQTRRAGER